MLELTPLDKTVAGKELIRMGIKIGFERGLKKGELIGEIQAIQLFMKHPVSSKQELVPKGIKALRGMLKKLEAELDQQT